MRRHLFCALLFLIVCCGASGQSTGHLRGKVTLSTSQDPVHNATVILVPLGRSVQTDSEGTYEFLDVPPGTYDVVAHLHPLADDRQRVQLKAGENVGQDLHLRIAAVQQQITVTASGRQETSLEAFQTVSSMQSLELAARAAPSLGDVLKDEPGVASRTSGPGTSRPVVRGFDGDRVLILQDGLPTGTLSYQSGDHGEPVDVTALERVEVVRGPATLLYGSNAIGGVVNTISSHHQIHQHPHEGLRGHLTGTGGTANALGGGSGGFEFGHGKWLLWGGGGGQRTGDYRTPLGSIENSHTRWLHTNVGTGYFGDRFFASVGYGVYDGRYGIPPGPAAEQDGNDHDHDQHSIGLKSIVGSRNSAEEDDHDHGEEVVDLNFRRHNVRFTGGVKNLGAALERFTVSLNYSDWNHNELADDEVHNRFFNKVFSYRGQFDQQRHGVLSGNFGFMGQYRDYKAVGEEAITPPVTQNSFALFALEQLDLETVRLQFGGRIENTRYTPGRTEQFELNRERSFTGFSGAAGVQVPLWRGGSFVTNYTHSYRAPALEELYARGPHVGNLTYEIGDSDLRRERANGLDLSLRHQASRVRGDVNFFNYWIGDYVYLAPTGHLEHGLIEAEYHQANALYRGAEARVDVAIHSNLWLNLGIDTVSAQLREIGTPLPRIPPVRGRAGFDIRYGGLSVRPSVLLANRQSDVFTTETPTAGFAVVNLDASYIVARQHTLHTFGVRAFNLGDDLYRNHLSFIKEFAPEIGRGVRVYYTVQTF
jgi:iron complex outermembrane recepter protein